MAGSIPFMDGVRSIALAVADAAGPGPTAVRNRSSKSCDTPGSNPGTWCCRRPLPELAELIDIQSDQVDAPVGRVRYS